MIMFMSCAYGAGQPPVGGKQKAEPDRVRQVCNRRRPWQIGAMRTSFLIPAYNEEKLIGRALASVHRACGECGMADYEIVVCDNASSDATPRIAAAAGAKVVFEPHRQIARARNAAASASRGTQLVWVDADAMLTSQVLAATVEAFAAGRYCGGGAQVELEGAELSWSALRTVDAWNWIARTCRLAAGSYFFAEREGWLSTGGFNEEVYAGAGWASVFCPTPCRRPPARCGSSPPAR